MTNTAATDVPFKSQIPADMEAVAENVVQSFGFNRAVLIGAIAGALNNEREASARIAEDHGYGEADDGPDCQGCGEVIGALIRKPRDLPLSKEQKNG